MSSEYRDKPSSKAKFKLITKIVLLVFVSVSFVYLFLKSETSTNSEKNQSGKKTSTIETRFTNGIKAYYFHTNYRCYICKTMEHYIAESINTYFHNELKEGKLKWQTINVDNPEHFHFVKDYKLYTKSLVIVEYRDGKEIKWKKLDKIWSLVRSKNEFLDYVKNEINNFFGS